MTEVSENCNRCGSGDIKLNIAVSQSVEAGAVGLRYTAGLIFGGTEALLADLCLNCGTVLRLHVARTDRKWDARPL